MKNKFKFNSEEIWEQYKKMIVKIGQNLSKKYKVPFDELLSEGVYELLRELPKYNSEKASLCTYVYRSVYFSMLTYCIKPYKEIPTDLYNNEEKNPFIQKEAKTSWIKNFLNELFEEERHLIKIILEAPEELFNIIRPSAPVHSMEALKRYMIDVYDWTTEDFNVICNEIQACL